MTCNCEFTSCNSEKKSQNCEIKSCNNLLHFLFSGGNGLPFVVMTRPVSKTERKEILQNATQINQRLGQMFNPNAGTKQPNRWVCPYFSQHCVVFIKAFLGEGRGGEGGGGGGLF